MKYGNVLDADQINDILENNVVIEVKEGLATSKQVYFSFQLSDSIKNSIKESLGLDLSEVSDIPMRWIRGDTGHHIDTGSAEFENTYLVYLTDSEGKLILGEESYEIQKGSGFVFSEGIYHRTINTGNEPRLLIGPMSERGFAVGTTFQTTTTTLLSFPMITLGESVTDTATVSPQFGSDPIILGTVTFQVSTDGLNFSTFGALKSLDGSGNAISDPYEPQMAGTYFFRAVYSGYNDDNTTIVGSQSLDDEEPLIVKNPIICIFPGAQVETPNGLRNIEDLRQGDIVISENNEEIEIINNIRCTDGYKGYTQLMQGCFGNNLPNKDIYITDNHPIKLPNDDGEIAVQELANNMNIIWKKGQIPETYSLITKRRLFVKMNGISVCTWEQNKFNKYINDETGIQYEVL